MSQSLKQSKLRLASDKIVKENLSNELKNVRLQRNELKESSLQNIQPQPFGIE
ncbi:17134_t:CDS:2 [Rhizophagus irregularis]|nr:17134_t:CDS:2 [Rhizophagus irregularis]